MIIWFKKLMKWKVFYLGSWIVSMWSQKHFLILFIFTCNIIQTRLGRRDHSVSTTASTTSSSTSTTCFVWSHHRSRRHMMIWRRRLWRCRWRWIDLKACSERHSTRGKEKKERTMWSGGEEKKNNHDEARERGGGDEKQTFIVCVWKWERIWRGGGVFEQGHVIREQLV